MSHLLLGTCFCHFLPSKFSIHFTFFFKSPDLPVEVTCDMDSKSDFCLVIWKNCVLNWHSFATYWTLKYQESINSSTTMPGINQQFYYNAYTLFYWYQHQRSTCTLMFSRTYSPNQTVNTLEPPFNKAGPIEILSPWHIFFLGINNNNKKYIHIMG